MLISIIFSSLETHCTPALAASVCSPSLQHPQLQSRTQGFLTPQKTHRMGPQPQHTSAWSAEDTEQQNTAHALTASELGSVLLGLAVEGWSHSCQHWAIIRYEHMLMAAEFQKPFFCPLEPNAEDAYGFVTDCSSEIERQWHTLLPAAQRLSAPGQFGFYPGARFIYLRPEPCSSQRQTSQAKAPSSPWPELSRHHVPV